MTEKRRQQVLKAIINHFIETAEPVGSNTIIVKFHFQVSPATIRNDMAYLEDEGLIYQHHTSAGRIPTDLGYRAYIDEMADYDQARKEATKVLTSLVEEYKAEKAKEFIYDAVNLLSRATGIASFSTIPDSKRTFFIGLSNILRQPEFAQDTVRASQVFEVFEHSDNFINTLKSLEIGSSVRAFIGEENIIKQIQSCTIIVAKYNVKGYTGYIGLLGPKRMNYAFNIAILEQIKDLLATHSR